MEATNWEHEESVFRNSSVSPPRNPQTRLPYNAFERPHPYTSEEDRLSRKCLSCPCEFHVQGWSSRQSTLPPNSGRDDRSSEKPASTLDKEMQNCDDMLTEVEGLRSEYHCTVNILEKLFENQKRLDEMTSTLLTNCERNHPELKGITTPPCLASNGQHSLHDHSPQNISLNSSASSSNASEPLIQQQVYASEPLIQQQVYASEPLIQQQEYASIDDSFSEESYGDQSEGTSYSSEESIDPFASVGMEAIETMWDDFSIDNYAPSSTWVNPTLDNIPAGDRPDTWRPKITIPKPFSMTIREEQRVKKKSRALIQAEHEKLEKEALEEAELNKPFRANPIPATTYLPLYEMINAQQDRRRQFVKDTSQKKLKAKERPFSFVERELKRLTVREEELALKLEQEQQELSGETFKAKPVPHSVLDPNIDEKLKEDEEYRKIRIRMRALELLADSHLPNRMRYKGHDNTVGQLRKLRKEELDKLAFLTAEHSFRPVISGEVPDHKQAYESFQRQLKKRKNEENLLTVTQPFTHRTDSRITQRKSQTSQYTANDRPSSLKSNKTVPPQVKVSKSCLKSSGNCHVAPVTRSAQLRHQANLHKLFKEAAKDSCSNSRQHSTDELLQREVSHRSIVNDVSFAMDVKRREKLQNLRYEIIRLFCQKASPLPLISMLITCHSFVTSLVL